MGLSSLGIFDPTCSGAFGSSFGDVCERLSWRAGLPPCGEVFFGGGGGGLVAGGCPCEAGGAMGGGADARSFSCIC